MISTVRYPKSIFTQKCQQRATMAHTGESGISKLLRGLNEGLSALSGSRSEDDCFHDAQEGRESTVVSPNSNLNLNTVGARDDGDNAVN